VKAAALLCLALATPAMAADDINQQRARLDELTRRVNVAAGRNFTVNRRIHADMNSRVFNVWLGAIAPNGVRATATGTAADGILVSRPRPLLGAVTARIDPASATRLDLTLANPRINAATDRLTINGDLRADARAQVRVGGLGPDQLVDCRTNPAVRERGMATFDIGTVSGTRIPYALRLTTPDDLRAGLECEIAELRRLENILPINSLAGNLSNGTINIGVSTDIRLPPPGAGRPLTIPINPRRPVLRVNPQGVAYSAD
jgi:hypothetical protein